MAGLDPRYITSLVLEELFVDKVTGEPLAGGRVFFFKDNNRTDPKTVYTLSGDAPNYSYVALPNPVNLSSAGYPIDVAGNNVKIYYFPFDEDGNQELYFVRVEDNSGVPQFTRGAQPNPEDESGGGDGGIADFNYIPNGQLLSHTTPLDNLLVGGENFIAQGGFVIELPATPGSDNEVEFIPINFSTNPSQSPRYELQLSYDASVDLFKNLGIRFNDVNKFSATDSVYTFAFWAIANVNVPISIKIFKFCGTTGTVVPATVVATDTITTTGFIHQYQFQFGTNAAYTIDTVNNDDYVQINIALPPAISPVIRFTDFMLILGTITISQFPIQTNADFITRGVYGWTDVPDGNGLDLYLSPVLTQYGMTWNRSQIGHGGWTLASITSPLSTSPLPTGNEMPLDGAVYPYHGRSTIGIPFSRLGDYFLNKSPIPGVPLFGTGGDFVTAYTYTSIPNAFRLVVNNGGVVAAASDGNTGWSFVGLNGNVNAGIGYTVFSTLGLTSAAFLALDNTTAIASAPAQEGNVNTGFTFNNATFYTGLLAQQGKAYFTVETVPASSLAQGAGNPAANWTFTNVANTLQVYYIVGGELPPPVLGIQFPIFLAPLYTAREVGEITTTVMNGAQITEVTVTTPAVASSYWLFSANPTAPTDWYVWYKVGGIGVDPLVAGRAGIMVELTTTEAADVNAVTLITQQTINKYQYRAPDSRGMFARGVDPNATYDTAAFFRWSTVLGLSGGTFGTYEFQNFLQHIHQENPSIPYSDPPNGDSQFSPGNQYLLPPPFIDTGLAGGDETRPVNFYVNWFVHY